MKKILLLLTMAALSVGVALAPAGAVPSTTVDIGQGNVNTKIGTATFTRTLQGDGTEVIGLVIDITGSGETLTKVHVCHDDSAFTARVAPGQCQFVFDGLSGTTFTRDLDLGSAYVGKQVCLQTQVDTVLDADATVTNTGYASWQAGSPFFGSLCLDPSGTEVPIGTWGALGLTGLVAAALGAVFVIHRRATAEPASEPVQS